MVLVANVFILFVLPLIFLILIIGAFFVSVPPKARKILILCGLLLSISGLTVMLIGRFQFSLPQSQVKFPIDLFSVGVLLFAIGITITRFKEKE